MNCTDPCNAALSNLAVLDGETRVLVATIVAGVMAFWYAELDLDPEL